MHSIEAFVNRAGFYPWANISIHAGSYVRELDSIPEAEEISVWTSDGTQWPGRAGSPIA